MASSNNSNNHKHDDDKSRPVVQNAKPTSHTDLPPIPPNADDTEAYCSVLLFYQYVEPLWNPSQHKRALRKVLELAHAHKVTGRGRVAPEGLNCTLTGPAQGIRAVCLGLRQFDALFENTDFKITDFVPRSKQFKSLSVRKTQELVAYGLQGDAVAPSLSNFAGTHLEATDWHDALQDPDAVVIDVRNFYETKLGAFKAPPGGAKLVDPKLRNSVEFPKWLADPKTQEELNGKKVLMYCTGGIRCERATALLNQMVAASEATDDNNNDDDKMKNIDQANNKEEDKSGDKKNDVTSSSSTSEPVITCKPKGVFELRGGIERYVKTFPQGGFWKGKNYLFDRRMEQIPEGRSKQEVEEEIDATCCLCQKKWTVYRGQYSCSSKLCGVPVIVCPTCAPQANQNPQSLKCDLCLSHYRPPKNAPDLVAIKRKAEERVKQQSQMQNDNQTSADDTTSSPLKKTKLDHPEEYYPDRLFVSRLPLTVTATKLKQVLLPVNEIMTSMTTTARTNKQSTDSSFRVHWLRDPRTNAFYGSCIVQMPNEKAALHALSTMDVSHDNDNNNNDAKKGYRIDKKRIRVSRMKKLGPRNDESGEENKSKFDDIFSRKGYQAREYPPIQ